MNNQELFDNKLNELLAMLEADSSLANSLGSDLGDALRGAASAIGNDGEDGES